MNSIALDKGKPPSECDGRNLDHSRNRSGRLGELIRTLHDAGRAGGRAGGERGQIKLLRENGGLARRWFLRRHVMKHFSFFFSERHLLDERGCCAVFFFLFSEDT